MNDTEFNKFLDSIDKVRDKLKNNMEQVFKKHFDLKKEEIKGLSEEQKKEVLMHIHWMQDDLTWMKALFAPERSEIFAKGIDVLRRENYLPIEKLQKELCD